MNYPKNKTQLIKFLRENPGIYYNVTRADGSVHMRKLSRPQTNAFAGHSAEGKESWFYYEKNDIYRFEDSQFIVESSGVQLIFEFNPSQTEIDAFEFPEFLKMTILRWLNL